MGAYFSGEGKEGREERGEEGEASAGRTTFQKPTTALLKQEVTALTHIV